MLCIPFEKNMFKLTHFFFVCILYFVDVIGLVTGMSDEREYIRDGKITKMVVIELTDERYVSLNDILLHCVKKT
jgi:hypothetical protein